jgi:hypothetical protein
MSLQKRFTYIPHNSLGRWYLFMESHVATAKCMQRCDVCWRTPFRASHSIRGDQQKVWVGSTAKVVVKSQTGQTRRSALRKMKLLNSVQACGIYLTLVAPCAIVDNKSMPQCMLTSDTEIRPQTQFLGACASSHLRLSSFSQSWNHLPPEL